MLTSEPTLTVDGPDRRVVQQVMQGPYAGIYRIIGRVSDIRDTGLSPNVGTTVPTFVDRAQMIDHWGAMALVEVNPRHILYRETVIKEADHVATVD